MFKDYIKTIGDFDKVSFEKEDFSPDVDVQLDKRGFGTDSSGFAPNTSSFSPTAGGNSFRPQYDAFTPVNQYGGYKPTGQNYGNFKPSAIDYGDYKPTAQDYGNFRPSNIGNFGNYSAGANNYRANTIGGYSTPAGGYGSSFKKPANNYW